MRTIEKCIHVLESLVAVLRFEVRNNRETGITSQRAGERARGPLTSVLSRISVLSTRILTLRAFIAKAERALVFSAAVFSVL